MKELTIILLVLFMLQIDCYSQSKEKNSGYAMERFQHAEYESFRQYVQRNLTLPSDAVSNRAEGVLLAGLQLDKNGKIENVFTLNSVYPSINNNVVDVFAFSEGHWNPISDSGSYRKNNIIIVPIVVTYGKLEYKLDRDNFKLPVADEVTITALGISKGNYKETRKLLGKYYRLANREKQSRAYKIINKLLKREPLNLDYYEALVKLEFKLGKIESASKNLKLIKTYFREKTDLTVPDEYSCD